MRLLDCIFYIITCTRLGGSSRLQLAHSYRAYLQSFAVSRKMRQPHKWHVHFPCVLLGPSKQLRPTRTYANIIIISSSKCTLLKNARTHKHQIKHVAWHWKRHVRCLNLIWFLWQPDEHSCPRQKQLKTHIIDAYMCAVLVRCLVCAFAYREQLFICVFRTRTQNL